MMPEYDVSFLCDPCIAAYGKNPIKGDFPAASVCEFKFAKSQEPWRIFICCEKEEQRRQESFAATSEYFRRVWQQSTHTVDNSQVSNSAHNNN